MGEPIALERLLRRERALTVAGLAVLCALAWAYVLSGAGLGMSAWDMTTLSLFPHKAIPAPASGMAGMAGMDMDGMESGGAPPVAWTPQIWLLTVAMWWTMMVAMMAPSAAPIILLYGRVRRAAAQRGEATGSGVFTSGYLLVWLGFSLAAAALQWGLQRWDLLSPAVMGSESRWLSAGVLLAAGVYQLSPFKNLCLRRCRAPAAFLSHHWRPGLRGALRLGVLHGGYCLGCCWLLMTLLFVGGVMNLAWIAALALLVTAEKLLPRGPWVGRVTGGVLILWGLATLLV
jgi:predicted metal-binding membrane protein